MAQHDYVIDNSTGANVRADINNALLAISSNNSGSSAPSTTYALQSFANTTDTMLQLRNAANSAFVNLRKFDGSCPLPDGSDSAPSLFFDDDTNTGVFSSAADTFNVTTGGVERMELGATTIFNETGADVDFRIEGDTFANLFYVDAGNDRIGINTNSPNQLLHLAHASGSTILELQRTDTNTTGGTGVINFTASDGHSIGSIGMIGDGDNEGGDIFFRTTTAAANNDPFNAATPEVMRITSLGRVAIGTTSPSNNFHVHQGDSDKSVAQFTNTTTGTASGDGFQIGLTSTEKGLINMKESASILFKTADSERMEIDSDGRLLINHSSSINSDGFQSYLQMAGTSSHTSSIYTSRFSDNASGSFLIMAKSRNGTVGSNTIVQDGDDLGVLLTHGNDGSGFHEGTRISASVESGVGNDDLPCSITFKTNNGTTNVTEKMRIGSNGVIGIGTSSPRDSTGIHLSKGGGECILEMQRNQTNTTGNVGMINFTASDGHSVANFGAFGDGDNEGANLIFKTTTAASANSPFETNTNERMRITSTGLVGINESGPTKVLEVKNTGITNFSPCLMHADGSDNVRVMGLRSDRASGSTSAHMIEFFNSSGSLVGNINSNGSSTSYNTSSDYRLKENATAISDGITRLKTLKPYRFNWKFDPTTTVDGFFAHEVTAVPEAVSGTKDQLATADDVNADVKEGDPIYQGIDHSKLVPLLVAAVQELITKVETLEAA